MGKTALHWAGRICEDHSCPACTDRDECEPYQKLFAIPADIMDIAGEMVDALKKADHYMAITTPDRRQNVKLQVVAARTSNSIKGILTRAREAGIGEKDE